MGGAKLAADQTSEAEEINQNISKVAEINANTANRTASASDGLQHMASKLSGIVGRFKL